LRNTFSKKERTVGLVRNIVQLSRSKHTYDGIILFIAIFGKERRGNERKKKKKKKKIGDFPS
jgi:hypothetical protein